MLHLTTKVLVSNIAKKYVKSIADTHIDTAYEKYRQYLRQYSKSIANTFGSSTNVQRYVYSLLCLKYFKPVNVTLNTVYRFSFFCAYQVNDEV